mmetsp:Transcript_2307/g.7395  ORF Transcript_2307/g.7395 Transcript_2307/m.7395 type:complete len:203 (-) Transcript_2307:397-1005(-)
MPLLIKTFLNVLIISPRSISLTLHAGRIVTFFSSHWTPCLCQNGSVALCWPTRALVTAIAPELMSPSLTLFRCRARPSAVTAVPPTGQTPSSSWPRRLETRCAWNWEGSCATPCCARNEVDRGYPSSCMRPTQEKRTPCPFRLSRRSVACSEPSFVLLPRETRMASHSVSTTFCLQAASPYAWIRITRPSALVALHGHSNKP